MPLSVGGKSQAQGMTPTQLPSGTRLVRASADCRVNFRPGNGACPRSVRDQPAEDQEGFRMLQRASSERRRRPEVGAMGRAGMRKTSLVSRNLRVV